MDSSSESLAGWSERHAEGLSMRTVSTSTTSGIEPRALYTPLDTAELADPHGYARKLGHPGEPPFTRGIHPGMYRQAPWVMGMYSGRASPQRTNQRIRSLLAAGGSGFSVALDLPTQLGMDSDDPLASGEVGRVGVPIDSVLDMTTLLDGVELDTVSQIRTTANAIGPIAVALFVTAAEEFGYSPDSFTVLLQNDALKEYVSRHTYIFPVERGCDFSVDVIEYCAARLPHWEPIEFCGYHIRDSGSTAVQEVAIAIANGREYIRRAVARGIDIDRFAHSLYMFLSAGLEIFEEAAKFRAARRIWADLMQREFGATEDASRALRIFCYTLGSVQTAQEPLNNVVRIAYQALAAALGGVQTLATSSFDEAIGLPSPTAAHIGLRTQQILAYETGIVRSADPLGGSYLVEALTDELEAQIRSYMHRIDEKGGAVNAIASGLLDRDIENAASEIQQRIDSGEQAVVGLNRFASTEPPSGLNPGEQAADVAHAAVEAEQVDNVQKLRAARSGIEVHEALSDVARAARARENTVPTIIDAVRKRATIGEICQALASVWGRYADHS